MVEMDGIDCGEWRCTKVRPHKEAMETQEVLSHALANLTFADPDVVGNFAAFPLLGAGGASAANYLRLDEALPTQGFRVTEVSEGGSVPELLVHNELDRPVLLLDGEQLTGAKQNRIVNLTILVAAQSKTTIPVSCVERGRWHHQRRDFRDTDRVLFQGARASKAAYVSESMRNERGPQSNQRDLWGSIAAKQQRTSSYSETGSVDSVYENNRGKVEDLVKGIRAREGQCGALFFIDGRPAGLELFDSSRTLAAYLPKLTRGYALEAFDRETSAQMTPLREVADAFLQRLGAAQSKAYAGVGLGEDLRLQGENLSGGALLLDGQVLHAGIFDLGGFRQSESTVGRGTRPGPYRS